MPEYPEMYASRSKGWASSTGTNVGFVEREVSSGRSTSMTVKYQVQSFPTTTYCITHYSNRFHACFSYSTIRIFRFLGLKSMALSTRNCGGGETAYKTGTRGSMIALCCKLRNRSRKRFPSGYEISLVKEFNRNKILSTNHLESA